MFGNMKDFTADQFTSTRWEDAEEKARFARRFIRFVESDFAERDFSQALYRRLSLCFGHIAHYNRRGFYEEFFTTTEGKVRFLRMTLKHDCYGDPAYTYSDVERALQSWLQQNGVLSRCERRLVTEQEAAERADWLGSRPSTQGEA
jgi:hypothetical protein